MQAPLAQLFYRARPGRLYVLTMKDMKLGAKEYMFNHERHETHESNNRNEAWRKYKSANCSGDSRNNSLTTLSYLSLWSLCTLWWKMAVFRVSLTLGLVPRLRDALCGEKRLFFRTTIRHLLVFSERFSCGHFHKFLIMNMKNAQ